MIMYLHLVALAITTRNGLSRGRSTTCVDQINSSSSSSSSSSQGQGCRIEQYFNLTSYYLLGYLLEYPVETVAMPG